MRRVKMLSSVRVVETAGFNLLLTGSHDLRTDKTVFTLLYIAAHIFAIGCSIYIAI